MPMTLSGDGTITGLAAGGLPDGSVTQAEIATGVAGKGPAFSAYNATTQSVTTGTFTKVNIDTEIFDTNSNFDTTLARFTPTVAGYYQVNGIVRASGTSSTQMLAMIYKNGAVYARGADIVFASSTLSNFAGLVSEIVFMNGSTDYLELYGYASATAPIVFVGASTGSTAINCRFSASLVRSA
jgi:hypothetical protein